ncbi:hypothetical protein BDW59DRAFT_138481 [Aspergillus cavernicola]|uniref:Amine oxidase domain-containing protein n=1 Tax=Aspergillus cavernicola TaxID=176166 RepID=A0ABR4J016_9EURO
MPPQPQSPTRGSQPRPEFESQPQPTPTPTRKEREEEKEKEPRKKKKKKVAIIGSGMAGLVTAFLLANDKEGRFEVVVFEMQERLSLDSASYTIPLSGASSSGSRSRSRSSGMKPERHGDSDAESDADADEEPQRVDLPMRAFAAGYYDNLRKMYTYLGVGFEEPRFVYSLSTLDSSSMDSSLKESGKKLKTEKKREGKTYFIHSSNNHILPPIRPPGMPIRKWIIEILYLLFWYVWFTGACFIITPRSAPTTHPTPPTYASKSTPKSNRKGKGKANESLRAYLHRINLPTYYTTHYFLPLMSSVTTCTHDELLEFPAVDVVGYTRRTYRRPHYTVKGGVGKAEGRLSRGLDVRFGKRVTGVEYGAGGEGCGKVCVSWESTLLSSPRDGDEGRKRGEEEYDYAILAVTPDVVGSIFRPLRIAMKAIPTTSVQSIVHRDFSRVENCSVHLRRNPRFRVRSSRSLSEFGKRIGNAPVSAAIHIFTDLSTSNSGSSSSPKTESIHEHPSSTLITTYPIDDNNINGSEILHRAQFTRVLRNVQSRDIVNSIFNNNHDYHDDHDHDDHDHNEPYKDTPETETETETEPRENKEPERNQGGGGKGIWKNGDGNIFLVGGWCWDGMVMLEGCIVSAIRVAEGLGVDVPWV